jgi:predicted Zn-dependent protease
LIGVSSSADFNAYASYFTNIMQSFRNLTDPSKLNKQPERVRIKSVRQTGSLEQALRNHNTPQARLNELAILNGMKLTDQVTQGMLIKVIEP